MTAACPAPAADRARLADVVASEWVKFMSLRSSRCTLVTFPVTAVVLGTVIAAMSGSHWATMTAEAQARFDPTNNVLAGLIPGYLVVPVLGLLAITSEYGHGAIRSSLSAVPDRAMLLAAKAVVVASVAFAVCEAATFATFALSQPLMGNAPGLSLHEPGVLRALVASGAYLALMGLFGLGLGTIVRHSGAGVALYAGVVLVAPLVVNAFPGNLARFGPIIILANSVTAAKVQPGFLSPAAGMAVMAVYAAAALAGGLALLVRRDA